MHRSGTSFVASLLLAAGVHMGDRLMPAAQGNPRGHFENLDFVEFQERMLRSLGYDEAGLLAAGPTPLSADSFGEEAYAEARQIVAANARETPWGWKDPRCTLLLDFWARVSPGAFYVLLYREPAEVLDSLFRRGDSAVAATPETAARVWLAYNSILLQFARMNRTRCIVANAAVVGRNPESFLSVVTTRFSIPLNLEIASTFDPELMRQIPPESAEPILLRYLVPETERLFVDLEGEADLAAGVHRDSPVSPKRARAVFFEDWASASQSTGSAAPSAELLESIESKEREIVDLANLTQERERELAEARGFLATANAEMQRAQAAFNELAPRASAAVEEVAALKAAAHAAQLEFVRAQEQLRTTRAERDSAIQEGHRLREAELELVRTTSALRFAEQERDAMVRRIEHLQQESASLYEVKADLAVAYEKLRSTDQQRDMLVQRVEMLQQDATALSGVKANLAVTLETLRFTERERIALEQRIGTLQLERDALQLETARLSDIEARAAEVGSRYKALEQERAMLAQRIETLQQKAVETDDRFNRIQLERDALQLETARLADIEARAAEAESRYKALEQERTVLLQRIDALQQETAALSEVKTSLAVTIETLRSAERERDALQLEKARLADIEARAAEVGSHYKALEQERAVLLQRIEALQQAVTALSEVKTNLAVALEALRFTERQRDALTQQIETLQQNTVETDEGFIRLQLERDTLAQQVESLQQDVAALSGAEEQAAEAADRSQALTRERDALAQQIETLQRAAAEAAQRASIHNADLEEQIEASAAQTAAARNELLGWLDKLEVVTNALAAERESVNALQAELTQEQQKHASETGDMRERYQTLTAALSEADARIEELRAGAERSQQQHAIEADTLRMQHKSLMQAIEVAHAQAAEQRDRETAVRTELDGLRASHKVMAKTLDETSSRFLAHVNLTLSQTHEEAQQIAVLIDEIQSSRFWGIKRALGRMFGRRDTTQ